MLAFPNFFISLPASVLFFLSCLPFSCSDIHFLLGKFVMYDGSDELLFIRGTFVNFFLKRQHEAFDIG